MSAPATDLSTPPTGPSRGATPRSGAYAGTATLARLALRRDRVRLPLWLVGVVGFLTVSAVSVPEVYPTAAERQARGEFVRSPVLTIFSGPGYGADDYTVGAMVANEYLIYGLVAVTLMSILLVVRHTRREEETGRAELVRASVVGARAAPAAALLVAVGANLVIGAATALALTAGMNQLSATGSLVFGASMAATGIVFAAVAAVGAQVTEHARGAVGIGVAVLAVAFLIRAAGDIGEGRALSWASPLGWAQSTQAFVDERWWPLGLSLAAAVALTALAAWLGTRRDVGAGLVAPRPGPARASRWLAQPPGLALRLQRSQLAAWALGLLAFGAVFGSLLGEVENFLADNPQLQEFFGAGGDRALLDAFLGTVLLLLALLASGFAVTAALQLRTQEVEGLAEPLLATALSRPRWAAGDLVVALGGGSLALLAAATGAGAAAAVTQGEVSWLAELLVAGLAHLPALWLLVALIVALHGLHLAAAPWGWVLLLHAGIVGFLGDTLDLPDAIRGLSPFHHVGDLPGGEADAVALVVLTAGAAGLIVVGLLALQRRDLHTS